VRIGEPAEKTLKKLCWYTEK